MEPFRIICETCHSRLKIRSPEVVGEIHACPKCGSMVHVMPPPGWQADAPATTGDAPALPVESTPALTATASVIIPATAIADLSTAPPAPEVESAQPLLPANAAAETGFPVVLWAVGGTAAAFLLAGFAWVMWPSSGDNARKLPPPTVVANANQSAAPPKSPQTAPPVEHAELPATGHQAANPSHVTQRPANYEEATLDTAKHPLAANVATAGDAPSNGAANTQPSRLQPPTKTKTQPPSTVTPPSTKTVAVSAAPAATVQPPNPGLSPAQETKHSPVLKFDPLTFDPDRLGATTNWINEAAASSDSIPNQASTPLGADHPPANPIASAGSNGVKETAPPGLPPAAQPASQTANRTIMVRRDQPAADRAPLQKLPHQLAIRLSAFQVSEMPIARLVETLSDISGCGITLDPIALEQAGLSPRSTVTVNEQGTTLEQILRKAVAQRRLDVAELGVQVRVILPKADMPRSTNYDVKDLAGNNNAAAIGKLIERFVAPATWESAGGTGHIEVNGTTLHIQQSDSVSRQIVIFCERLRLARGLSTRSKYPPALLTAKSPYERLAPKLSEHTTFTFLDGTRLANVVHQWQAMSNVTILVDWAALTEADLSPATPIACSAIDHAWADALDGILEPLGLAWWAVDGETIQITTLTALEKIHRIEFYQVPPKLRAQFTSDQSLIDALQKEIGTHAGKQGATNTLQLAVDEPSGRLIVLASPVVHRYLSGRFDGAKRQ
ncbi:MAG TPA: hypothetical protein VHE81_10845 [Lacipirellulaceae bacterium]|nr:hypothetical protein [Lacipirellulaceae bacterium]